MRDHTILYATYTAIVIIVTSKICLCLISTREIIPKDAKLNLNLKGLSETEIYKTQSPVY